MDVMRREKRNEKKGMQSINQERRIKWIGVRGQKVDKLTTETKMPFSTPAHQRHSWVGRRGQGEGGTTPPSRIARLSPEHAAPRPRYNESCVFVRGADLTSTSYVYSSLVQDDSGRVVGGAAVDTPVPDLGAGDVQVADHVPFRCDHLADAVATALEDGVIVQGPGDRGQGCPLHIAHEGHWFCRAHHFLAKGRNDFGSSICRETKREGKWHMPTVNCCQVHCVLLGMSGWSAPSQGTLLQGKASFQGKSAWEVTSPSRGPYQNEINDERSRDWSSKHACAHPKPQMRILHPPEPLSLFSPQCL